MILTRAERADLLVRLGEYLSSESPELQEAKELAFRRNGWFIPPFVDFALATVARCYLDPARLFPWLKAYREHGYPSRRVGIVMAGNIPAVGFHDLLCGFLAGHFLKIKLSSRDEVLMRHLIDKLKSWEPALEGSIVISEMLRDADAYIATGSNNTARYFEYYFAKYPHLIRRNRTSVAILDGTETPAELAGLSEDVFRYFGLGCRNVTKLYVPAGYVFLPLLEALKSYRFLLDDHHYRNNFDYNLSIALLNKEAYMTNDVVLLLERPELFSRIGVLHYETYSDPAVLEAQLAADSDIQAVVGHGHLPFGSGQTPSLEDFADGVDTMAFLTSLS